MGLWEVSGAAGHGHFGTEEEPHLTVNGDVLGIMASKLDYDYTRIYFPNLILMIQAHVSGS